MAEQSEAERKAQLKRDEDAELAERVVAAGGVAPVEDGRDFEDWADEDSAAPSSREPDAARSGAGEEPGRTVTGAPVDTKVRKLTAYRVLESVTVRHGEVSEELWREVGVFEGSRALDLAHDQILAGDAETHGALVAVPNRSWNPKRPVEKPRPPVVGWE